MLLSSRFSRNLLILLIAIFCSWAALAQISGFEKIAENEYLILYINNQTTEIAVEEKSSGEIWYSNPPDRNTGGARGIARNLLNSQLKIIYYDLGDRMYEMNTYGDAILNEQYTITPLENGVRVDYIFGKEWKDEDYVARIIEKEKFENEVLANLPRSERDFLLDQYFLINMVERAEGEELLSIYGINTEEVFRNYKIEFLNAKLTERDQRIMIQNILKEIVEGRGYASINGIKHEDLVPLINNPVYVQRHDIIPWDVEYIIDAFKEAGYHPEMVQEDHSRFNYEIPHPNVRKFEAAIEYILDEEDLVVRVPGDSIVYPVDVIDHATGNRITLPLTTIEVLPYFEAANAEKEGYIFIPDGSGALINLNNNKTNLVPYRKQIYGIDFSVQPIRELQPFLNEQIYLPVYGMKQNEKGFLAIVEEGDAIGSINAEISGMRDSYNKVYASFEIIPKASVDLAATDNLRGETTLHRLAINMYQARNYKGDIKIRYKLLKGEEAEYTGMARIYQEYLVEKYNLTKIEDTGKVPFFLELIGAIDKEMPVMGVPRNVTVPLTTYKEANIIINELLEKGVEDLVIKYTGWTKGGIRHVYPDKVRLDKKLGNREDFDTLLNTVKENDLKLFPDIAFLNIYRDKILDGFVGYRDSARFLSRRRAYIFDEFNPSNHQPGEKQKDILSTSRLEKLVDEFLKSYNKFDLSGLSLRYMGKQVNSDFRVNPDELVDRQQAKNHIVAQLKRLSRDYELMVNGGNAYSLPYVSYIIDMPLYSDGESLFDKGVPFFQMVLHGYIYYTGEPINLANMSRLHCLKLIETGAIPYYRWSYGDSSIVKKSDFDDQFSIYYKDHLDEAIEFYESYSSVMSGLKSQRITGHRQLAFRVYETVYENGDRIIVNYNQDQVEVDGYIIPGEDYRLIKGER